MRKSKKPTTVGLRIGEALVYAIGKALHESGLQSQVILQDVGRVITERLVEQGFVDLTDDPLKTAEGLSRFFSSAGLLDEAIFSKDDNTLTIEWRNWRILQPIRNLMSKGCSTIPCPLTLAVFSVFRESGFALQPETELQVIDESKRNALQKFRIVNLKSRPFEEEAERISEAMDSELNPK